MSRRGPWLAMLGVLLVCASCGSQASSSDRSGTRPGAKAEVLRTVLAFYDAYTKAESERVCHLLTPAAADRAVVHIARFAPRYRDAKCTDAVIPFYSDVSPADQPRAIKQAASIAGDGTWPVTMSKDGRRARVTFPDGGRWYFQKAERWLISRLPL